MSQLKDMLGRVLEVGDTVTFVGSANGAVLSIGKVKKLHRTRIEVAYKGLWGPATEVCTSKAFIKIQ